MIFVIALLVIMWVAEGLVMAGVPVIYIWVAMIVLPLAWHFYDCIKCLREPWPFDDSVER